MLSQLQQEKVCRAFSVFDRDGDGYLEERDLLSLASDLARENGARSDDAMYQRLQQVWEATWNSLAKVSDGTREGLVSPAEWLKLADSNLAASESFPVGEATFDSLDADGDGVISADDWAAFYRALGIEQAGEVFARFDADGDGKLSRAETLERLREFFASSDADVAGNWFFGIPTAV
jgi:Ca2+-binding EF-hand superfamily protein